MVKIVTDNVCIIDIDTNANKVTSKTKASDTQAASSKSAAMHMPVPVPVSRLLEHATVLRNDGVLLRHGPLANEPQEIHWIL